jgi:hypothetical protein
MATTDQLFTPLNIASTGVATMAVNVAANTFTKLLKWRPEWTAFGAALIIAYLIVAIETSPLWYEWILAFFNACLLFCSAFGLNEVGKQASTRPGKGFVEAESFFTQWFRR